MGFPVSINGIRAAQAAGKRFELAFQKTGPTPEAAGSFCTFWAGSGNPGAGAAPAGTPGAAYDNTTGGLYWPDLDPDEKGLLRIEAESQVDCTLLVYDRLVGVGGITCSDGAKTVNSAALTRHTDGIEVEAWLEVTTVTATAAPTFTMNSYTDEDGNTGQVATAGLVFPAIATNVGWAGRLPVLGSDRGVRACAQITASGGSAVTGIVNFILCKRLMSIPLRANVGNSIAFTFDDIPRIYDGATIFFIALASSTTIPVISGRIAGCYD